MKISQQLVLNWSVNRTIVATTLSPRNVHRMCRDQIGLRPISFGPDANKRRNITLLKPSSFGSNANKRRNLTLLKPISFGPDERKVETVRHILDDIDIMLKMDSCLYSFSSSSLRYSSRSSRLNYSQMSFPVEEFCSSHDKQSQNCRNTLF